MEFQHISILLSECLDSLNIRPDGVYVDATLGGAGHSLHIAQRLTEGGRLISIDRDDMALANAEKRLAEVRDRVTLVKSDFRNIDTAVASCGVEQVDGILFDLGVSSPQLDIAERGFSYMHDAKLDMRMDQQQPLSAYEVVNEWDRNEIRRILWEYGEERYAPQIAAAIQRAREQKPIETTLELADIIREAMPPAARREKQHPAKRSFQAIRIAVNDELKAVQEAMERSIDLLAPGGRLAVITFHSLEDRIVKNAFRSAAQGCTCPKDFPVCVCGKQAKVKLVARKPLLPSIPIESAEQRKMARKKERARIRRSRERIRKLVIAAMIAIVMAGAVGTVVGYIQVTDLTKKVEDKQAQLAQLESECTSLKAKKENSVDLSQVENYAENVLGLVKLDRSQEEYLELQKNDQVQVNEGSSGVEKLASSFVKSFSAILSFLR